MEHAKRDLALRRWEARTRPCEKVALINMADAYIRHGYVHDDLAVQLMTIAVQALAETDAETAWMIVADAVEQADRRRGV